MTVVRVGALTITYMRNVKRKQNKKYLKGMYSEP